MEMVNRHTISTSFGVLLGITIGSSVAILGANFPFGRGLLPLFCALLMLASLAYSHALPAPRWGKAAIVGMCLALLVACVVVPLLQVVPLGGHYAQDWANPVWRLVDDTAKPTISLNPTETLNHILYALGYMAFAVAIYRGARHHPSLILRIAAVCITVAAVYGIMAFASGNTRVLWLPKSSYMGDLSGTFINRNSFATLLGLGMVANLGLALQRVGEISRRLSMADRLRAFWLLVIRPGWPWAVFSLICFVALVLTHSRAGTLASLCGVIVLLGTLAGMRPAVRLPLGILIALLMTAALVVLSLVGGALGSRLASAGDDIGARTTINEVSLQSIAQYPLTGTGFGTYDRAYELASAPDRLARVSGTVAHAHNTYYELATELGLPAALLLGGVALLVAGIFVYGVTIRRRAVAYPAVALAGWVVVAGHAMADFSLSNPAVALVAIVLTMLGLSQSLSVGMDEATRKSKRLPSTIARAVLVLVAVIMILASAWISYANWYAMKAETVLEKTNTSANHITYPQLVAARDNLQQCLAINPYHPSCGFMLGQANLSLATTYGVQGPKKGLALVFLNMARFQYEEALNHGPANPVGWYRLARITGFLGQTDASMTALTNSVLTGAADPTVAFLRIPLMLSYMPYLNKEDSQLYASNLLGLWNSAPWYSAPPIRGKPDLLSQMWKIVGDDETGRQRWKTNIGTPLPSAIPAAAVAPTPLEPATETR